MSLHTPSGRWPWMWMCILLLVSLLGVIFFTSPGRMFLGVFVGMKHIRVMESRLRKPEIYQPVALRLATYCQSDRTLFPQYLSHAWLPAELAQVGHGRTTISTNHARVEMGGGFHHFGYRLELDGGASTSA